MKADEVTKQYLADIHAAEQKKLKTSTAVAAALQCQQGDRGSADDDPDNDKLPVFARFKDIQRAGIADNWPTLLRLIKQENFPQGIWLGRNTRAWEVSSILAWIKDRPTALKVVKVVPRKKHQQQDQQNAETPAV